MISIEKAKRCCPEHYKEIENYVEAVNDTKNKWVCHHRNGEEFSVEWLKKNNMYFNRKDPHEFKFIKDKEHRQLHRKLEYENNPEEIIQRAVNNLSKNISGKNNPFYGKHHTSASKNKIRMSKIANGTLLLGDKNPSKRADVKKKISDKAKKRLSDPKNREKISNARKGTKKLVKPDGSFTWVKK